MNITVKTNALNEPNGSTIAVSNVSFGDAIKIKNVTVKEGKNGRFVSMPSYPTNKVDEKGDTIYQDVFNPITKEGREKLYDAILSSLDTGKEVVIDGSDKTPINARVVPLENSVNNGVLAVGRIYLNEDFVLNNVTIRETRDGGKFVAFPSYKSNEVDEQGRAVYKEFAYPSSKESRDNINKIVMAAYQESKEIAKTPVEKAEQDKPEVLKDEKPRGIKAKLKEGEEKSKKSVSKAKSEPKKAKEAEIG